jgi:hypothetical protein
MLPHVEHSKNWLLRVLVDVKCLYPLPWCVTKIRDPIRLKIIGPEGTREFKPQFIHHAHTEAINGVSLSLSELRNKIDFISLENAEGNSDDNFCGIEFSSIFSCDCHVLTSVINIFNWFVEFDSQILGQ